MKAGVALNPHTPVRLLEDILGDLDLVCLMSVNPGFGGQGFIENTYNKIEALAEMRRQRELAFHIEIDGGVTVENAARLVDAGATVLVAGSTVFKSDTPMDTVDRLLSLEVAG